MKTPEWWSENPEIKDQDILENAQIAAQRKINIGRTPRSIGTWSLRIGLPLGMSLVGTGYYADSHPQQTSEFLTSTIGRDNTLWIEGEVFKAKDQITKFEFSLGLGPNEKPYETPTQLVDNAPQIIDTNDSTTSTQLHSLDEQYIDISAVVEPEKPKPFILPDTHILFPNPLPGEGSWTIDGLPTTVEDLIMAKTFIRPDQSRPYANTVIIVMDSRRVRLNMVGGKGDPKVGGGHGPGKVPDSDLSNLLLVMNGGFQLAHDTRWGAFLDGIEYQPLKPGFASTVVYKDGSIKIGTWGEGDLTERSDDMISVRQNSVLLINKGEITQAAKNERDVRTWGLLAANSSDFITFRSAIGLTKDGNLVIANGSSMSALNLAKGMEAAGTYIAMQLDINLPWVQTGVVTSHNQNGYPILSPIMDSVSSGKKFLNPQERDLIYVTRDDDSRYIPKK